MEKIKLGIKLLISIFLCGFAGLLFAENSSETKILSHLESILAGKSGDLQQPAEYYQSLIEKSPNVIEGYVGLAIVAFEETNYSLARKYFSEAIKLQTDKTVLHRGMAATLASEHRYSSALKILQSKSQQEPGNLKLLKQQLDYASLAGDEQIVLDTAKNILAQEQNYAQGWLQVCKLEKTEDSCLAAIELAPNLAEPFYYIAEIYQQRNWLVHSLWYAQKYLHLSPYGDLSMQAQKLVQAQLDAIGQNYSQIEVKTPNQVIYVVQDLTNIEKKLFTNNNFQRAAWRDLSAVKYANVPLLKLDDLVHKYPDFALAYYSRGLLKMQDDQELEPTDDFIRAIQLSPNWGRPYTALVAYMMRNKSFSTARFYNQQAVKYDESDITAFNNKILGYFDEAVVQYTLKELQNLKVAVEEKKILNLGIFDIYVADMEEYKKRDPTAPVRLKLFSEQRYNQSTFMLGDYAGYLQRDPTSFKLFEAYGDILAADPGRFYTWTAENYYRQAIELGGDKAKLQEKINLVLLK